MSAILRQFTRNILWGFAFAVLFALAGDLPVVEDSEWLSLETVFQSRLSDYPRARAADLATHLQILCAKYGLDPAYVLSIIEVESDFQVKVISSAGAVGLLQIMPATAAHVARKNGLVYGGANTLSDPLVNLKLGTLYLKELHEHYPGMPRYYELAAYNIGPRRLDELMKIPGFRPRQTLKYYLSVMQSMDRLQLRNFHPRRQRKNHEFKI